MSTKRPLALITGASSGIGADLAREYAADGHDLILVARGEAALSALAGEVAKAHGVTATVITADLLDPAAPRALIADIEGRGLVVDVLVNNAGFGDGSSFAKASRDKTLGMIQVNITALTDLMHAVLPGMVARGKGSILNVASTAAFQPGPSMAVYCATKAYVLSLSEAVAEEVKGTGVTVTALCPGPTRTNFMDVADVAGNALFSKGLVPVMTSAEVARIGHAAAKRGQVVSVAGILNQIGALAPRFTPRSVTRKLTGRLLASGRH
ncbi:SDR family NAD(P)-dependent oxidoreductase [Zavarzinia aquatilis]|uniref:Short-chain dehydrogenase n=1 Tax=Zavarzinia aquatilis TaxID=2211142 RepID=A0A317DXQ3_9PROT|nr:SDR family oxidoreductase [Zavarzinia aquatilis]PWR17595.1 short-chain dehydrogenase [Zavarzinia aquatilis]